jgi:hypothetical protein
VSGGSEEPEEGREDQNRERRQGEESEGAVTPAKVTSDE